MVIAIPGHWATAGYGVPSVCAKHGQLEARRPKVGFASSIPGWNYFLLLAGLLIFFVVRMATRKALAVPAWPFCATCVRQRNRLIWMATGCVAGGLALFVAAVAGWLPPAWAVLALVLIVAGPIVLVKARWQNFSGAQLSDDAAWITIAQPHAAFEEQFAPYIPGALEVWNSRGGVRPPARASGYVLWILLLVFGSLCVIGGRGRDAGGAVVRGRSDASRGRLRED